MSSLKDQDILETFLESSVGEDMYNNEFRSIDASTNNNSVISFSNQTLRSEWISLRDSFVTFTLTISLADATKKVCFKRSILDFISQVQFSINGQSVISKSNLEHYNYWRLLLESSKAYEDSPDADQEMFYPSNGAFGVAEENKGVYPLGVSADGTTIALANSLDTKFDEGFYKKLIVMGSYISDTTYVIPCKIQLKHLHPFFASDFCKIPLINFNLQLTLGHNKSQNDFVPLYSESGAAHAFTITEPQWWVRHLTFSSDQALQVAQLMKSKFTKEIQYSDVEIGSDVAGGAKVLSTTCVMPQRVFFCNYPERKTSATDEEKEIYPAVVNESKQPSSYNIEVNNLKYFATDLSTEPLQYTMLSEACHQEIPDGSTALVSYHNWRKFQKVGCVSLRRLKNRSNDPTQVCTIKLTNSNGATVNGVTGSVTGNRTHWAVEYQKILRLSFDNGSVVIQDSAV